MHTGRKCSLAGLAFALVGCTDYNEAVDCAAAFQIAAEQSATSETILQKELAEADAEWMLRWKSSAEIKTDIRRAKQRQRAHIEANRLSAFDSSTYEHCSMWYS